MWHYGVIRKTNRRNNKTCHYYQIHKIFDEKTWTTEPITPLGEDLKELQIVLGMMITDTARFPVYEIRKGKLYRRNKVKRIEEIKEYLFYRKLFIKHIDVANLMK